MLLSIKKKFYNFIKRKEREKKRFHIFIFYTKMTYGFIKKNSFSIYKYI